VKLRQRPLDLALFIFFFVNLSFITYVVDLEQLVIADPAHFEPPVWPPMFLLSLVHWWAQSFDPLQWARPVWWRATIWIDVLAFGPFYVAALNALWRDKKWIAVPALVWSGMMLSNVSIIMLEEAIGPHASPRFGIVTLANAAWFLMPFVVIYRYRRR
jgi:EXPERA (EXPanded EBP superfamily)